MKMNQHGAALLLLACLSGQTLASTTAFDAQFGENGKKLGTGFPVASLDVGRALIALTDGKWIVAGTTSTAAGKGDLLVTRLLANGDIDTSFGQQGSVNLDAAFGDDFGYHAVQQTDGKILVAGGCSNGKTVPCVFRLNADGGLDTSFATQGKFLYSFFDGDGSGRVTKLALQSDGKIVAVGARDLDNHGASSDPFALRLNSNGSLDSDFANGGFYRSTTVGSDWAESVAVDSDGRIVLAIYSVETNLVAERLTSAGVLDNTFNGNGRASYDGGNYDWTHAIAVDSNNSVLLGGRSRVCGWTENPCQNGMKPWNATLVRFDEAGTLDTSFGINGVASFDHGGTEYTTEILVHSDNSVFWGGTGYLNSNGTDYFTFLSHLDSSGNAVDFGGYPVTINDIDANAHVFKAGGRDIVFLRGLARLSTGEIAYSGTAYDDNESSQLAVVKLDVNGSPTDSFRPSGHVLFSVKKDGATKWKQALRQDAGHQVLLGFTGVDSALVARIDNDGNFDTEFGSAGVQLVDVQSTAGSMLADAAVTSDGSVAMAFAASPLSSDPSIQIKRLTASGQLQTAFGGAGSITTSFDVNYNINSGSADGLEHVHVAFQADGKVVTAVSGRKVGVAGTFLARFNGDGTQDGSLLSVPAIGNFELRDFAVDSFNRLYLVGAIDDGGSKVVRLTSSGDVDSGFGSSGWLEVAESDDTAVVEKMILLDNSLFVSGSSGAAGNAVGFVTKASLNGLLDNSFGGTGTQHYALTNAQSVVRDIQIRSDGKLQLTGSRFVSSMSVDGQMTVWRTLTNGSVDTAFGVAGVISAPSDETSNGFSATLLAGGRMLAAGQCGREACLLRANTDAGVASLSTATLSFGTIQVASTSGAQTLTLSNTGAGPLSISALSVNGDYTFSHTCPIGELEVGENCTVSVQFAPTTTGNRNGSLSITLDDGTTSASLTGVGTSATTPGGGGDEGNSGGGGGGSIHWLLLMLPILGRRRAH